MKNRLSIVILGFLALTGFVSPIAAVEIWDSDLGWTRLTKLQPTATEGGVHFQRELKSKKSEIVKGERFQRDDFLHAHSTSKITFTFNKPITEFRAALILIDGGTKGNVTYKVETDEGEVFKSGEISHAKGNKEVAKLTFKPTKTLILSTAPNRAGEEDWAIWLGPDVK